MVGRPAWRRDGRRLDGVGGGVHRAVDLFVVRVGRGQHLIGGVCRRERDGGRGETLLGDIRIVVVEVGRAVDRSRRRTLFLKMVVRAWRGDVECAWRSLRSVVEDVVVVSVGEVSVGVGVGIDHDEVEWTVSK